MFLVMAPGARAAEYTYDQKESHLTFTLRHFNIVTVFGHFRKFTGKFRFDPANIEASDVQLTIDSASLESGNKIRDNDLRSEDFFWTEKHPAITFVCKMVRDRGETFDIYGDLTIRGIKRPVIFVTRLLTPKDQVAPDKPIKFHTETYIRRKDYKLGTSKFFNPIMMVTNETLKISLDVEGSPAA